MLPRDVPVASSENMEKSKSEEVIVKNKIAALDEKVSR